jgi:sulfite reductase alpha subunit-like flavoprotein
MNFIIFLISTTGDGEPPDSLVKLWEELLNKSLPKELFTFKFSVFGFGDSKYGDHFNAMARKL